MIDRKFIFFMIALIAFAIVVFNNITQIVKEIFSPQFNSEMWAGFLFTIFGIIIYGSVNKNIFRGFA